MVAQPADAEKTTTGGISITGTIAQNAFWPSIVTSKYPENITPKKIKATMATAASQIFDLIEGSRVCLFISDILLLPGQKISRTF